MHPPCEMMMETFLPSMRALVSRRLSAEGFSQGRISRLLGITQASVSHYLSSDPGEVYRNLSTASISREEAERYSSILAEDVKKSPIYAVSTLYSIWSGILGRGRLCTFHRQSYPFLSECDVCMRTFGTREASGTGAREEVSRAAELLESSASFVHVMPEVSVNIAYAPGEAMTPEGVIAIPGRIVKVRSAARSLSRPEYGASSHLAKVLITVRRVRKDIHAVMNIRFDAKMAAVVRRLGLRSIKTGMEYPRGAEDPVAEGIRLKLATTRKEFDTIIDKGGPGLEPSLYLLGSDPVRVARLAIKISRAYSSI